MKYNYKDKYFNPNNVDITKTEPEATHFCFPFLAGDGTRENPTNELNSNFTNILSNGVYRSFKMTTSRYGRGQIIGNGKRNTHLIDFHYYHNDNLGASGYFKDVYLKNPFFTSGPYPTNEWYIVFSNCIIDTLTTPFPNGFKVTAKNSLLKELVNAMTNYQSSSLNNSFYKGWYTFTGNLSLFDKCEIGITQAIINSYQNSWFAFNDCKLKIGSETQYTPLTGDREEEYRINFINRCTAQGISLPTGTDEPLKMHRWVFANNAAIEGVVLSNSVIHEFEKRKLVYFGYTSLRDGFSVSSKNKKNTFNPYNPHTNFEMGDDTLKLPGNIDISTKKMAYSDSNVMWLGGKNLIDQVGVFHNFKKDFGVNIDTTPSLSDVVATKITGYDNGESKIYLIRSNNTDAATVTYNNAVYSSALATKKNIIKSISGITNFTASNNAVVYEITDELQFQTLQIKVVAEIPQKDQYCDSGKLLNGYIYLVEHDTDQNNATDHIIYKGVKYPVLSSLVVDGDLTFQKSGNVHLRRCWKNDFDYNTENTDKLFWTNKQKPEWLDIVDDDMRCFMLNNNPLSNEMQRATDGKYLTSGHPEFYKRLVGESGIPRKDYPIQGAYIQVRLKLTTLNPM